MNTSPTPAAAGPAGFYRIAFFSSLAGLAILVVIASSFYATLVGISPCYGGLGPGGPACLPTVFSVTQLGFVNSTNGSYHASIVLGVALGTGPSTNQIVVQSFNGTSGDYVPLSSVSFDSTQGVRIANLTLNDENWSTTRSLPIWNAILIQVVSRSDLVGTVVSVEALGSGLPVDLT
jgi:hypothetical protein